MKQAATLFTIFLFLILGTSVSLSQVPDFTWTTSAGGLQDDYCYGMKVDAAGNTYATGKFKSTPMDFGGGVSLSSVGNFDIYIVKYDPNGNPVWARQAGSEGTASPDEGRGLAVDAMGNVIVTGAFFGIAYFGTDTLISDGNFDVFIVKYDADGNYQWVIQGAGVNQDKGTNVAVDNDGNYIVTGYFAGSSTDTINFNGYLLTGSGNRDGFVVKLDPSGNVLWATNIGGVDSGEEIWGLDVDPSNNIYIAGFFSTTASFGTFQLISDGGNDIFTAKIDPSGTFLWVNGMHGPSNDKAYALDYSAGSDEVAVTGYFEDTLYVNGTEYITNGLDDIIIAAYTGGGALLGSGAFGSTADDHGWAIAEKGDGIYYVAGYIDADLVVGNDTLYTNGAKDIVVFAMYQDSLIWMDNYGGLDDDECYGIGIDAGGDVYIAGQMKSLEGYFGSDTLYSAGLRDLVVCSFQDLVVPVELLSFEAKVGDNSVVLSWVTATETNNSGFEVQRGTDQNNLNTIAFVEGHGTTAKSHSYSFMDNLPSTTTIYYRLCQVDFDGSFTYSNVIEVNLSAPLKYQLLQNYPNPFNPVTNIRFELPFDAQVQITVFNVLGQEVANLVNADYSAGRYNVEFDGTNLTSGIYFYRINADGVNGSNYSQIKKMVLTK